MRLLIFAAAMLLLAGGPVVAQTALPGAAAFCANCHGTDGRQRGPIPAIAGLSAAVIIAKLNGYRDGTLSDATVMPRLAKGLTEAEIQAAAHYFSQIR